MDTLSIVIISAFIVFIFGCLSHILYGVIANSRNRKRVGNVLIQEIQANFYQVRDGRNYAISTKEKLGDHGQDENVVINNYDFNFIAYETNITDIPLLKNDLSVKIHHFYSRLKTLQITAEIGSKLFAGLEEINSKKKDVPKNVKAIDAKSISADFFQILDEYHQFETQVYNLGNELLEIMG